MKEAGHILPVVFIIFWLYHVAHRTIVPPPETEPMPPVLEQGVLTTRPPGKSLSVFFAHISGFTFDLSPFDRDLGFLGSSAGKESVCHFHCIAPKATDSLRPPWTVACQAPLSMELSQQEYWSR